MADRARALLKEHWLFAIVLAAIVASRMPFLLHLHEIVLLGQDFNPEHFARLFLYDDIPAADDSETGENARTFSLVSVYYWLPLLLYRLGIPFEAFFGLHALLVLPLISLGIYRLALALFGDRRIASLAVCVFLFQNFALFDLNLGYPILLNSTLYHSDVAYVFVIFALASMARGHPFAAACWIAGLFLFNPTSGSTLALPYGLYLWFSGRLRSLERRTVAAFAVIGLAAAVEFLCVMAATPIRAPAPPAAREFAILSSYHFTPHIISPLRFLLAQVVLAAGLLYAVIMERALARDPEASRTRAPARHLSYALLASYLALGWVGYWLLFLTTPTVLLIVAPAKIFMIAAIYVSVYAAYAFYAVWVRHALVTLAAIVTVVLYFEFGHARFGNTSAVWLIALATISIHLAGSLARKRWLAASGGSLPGLSVLLGALLFSFGDHATRVFRSGEIAAARALYQIEREIREKTPAQAVFVPYRYPGTTRNRYGPFSAWPFRTYSRRGAYLYWALGRNLYYNSAGRHQLEVRGYAAFGIDVWNDMLREAGEALRKDPLYYYTGLRLDGPRPRLEETPIWTAFIRPIDHLESMISGMGLDEYMRHAARLGATHVIVSRDPGAGTELKGVLENDYFVVVPVTASGG